MKLLLPKVIKAVFTDRNGYISRKLSAAWILTTGMATLLIAPSMLGLVSEHELAVILSSSDFTTIITFVWASYFSSDSLNTWLHSKKNESKTKEEE